MKATSIISFLILLLLIAKGYTITRARLSRETFRKLITLILLYIIAYLATFTLQLRCVKDQKTCCKFFRFQNVPKLLFGEGTYDAAKTISSSESLLNYMFVGLRLIAWLWYCTSVCITVSKYPLKRMFWMNPVSVFIAKFLLDNWVRTEMVNAVDNCVMAYGFIVLLVLMCPSSVNTNFPYHVRTTQITDTNTEIRNANFPHHAYEVRYFSNPKPISSNRKYIGNDDNTDDHVVSCN
ncbi:unnamed protein product [Dracunculus medinensis]|uniref:Transmembrane protein n=1 Tax=Dracunculus medinensis TaxID=318479 RepID=A0A0N4U5D9_DRAME|nr:unnamed protein product [Dracunculus medinensis]